MIDDNYKDASELAEEQIRNEAIGRKGAKTSRKALAIWALVDWQKQEATRPETMKLFREIEARNNKALDEDIKRRVALQDTARNDHKSKSNVQRNAALIKKVGLKSFYSLENKRTSAVGRGKKTAMEKLYSKLTPEQIAELNLLLMEDK